VQRAALNVARNAMSRTTSFIAAAVLLYIGTYVAFRQSDVEIWERDKQAYVIFPGSYGRLLYYAWRPLSHLDAAITGMQHHIGPHR
jgi:hypothetical protein